MQEAVEIEIPVRIECDQANGDGAMWDVKEVIDERKGYSLGDIGVYEIDGFDNDFPEKLMNAVINTLEESGEFERKENFYSIKLNIFYGGNKLGSASRHFYGYQNEGK